MKCAVGRQMRMNFLVASYLPRLHLNLLTFSISVRYLTDHGVVACISLLRCCRGVLRALVGSAAAMALTDCSLPGT